MNTALIMNLILSVILLGLAQACLFEECGHPDFGSCGNACCRLSIYIKNENTMDVMNKLKNSIISGGPDNLYIPMKTADGVLFTDLRSRSTSEHFLGQAYHTTENRKFNDTLNFLISSRDRGRSSSVTAFSISQIGGAYTDSGQNFYNLHQLFDKLEWSDGYRLRNADSSCSSLQPQQLDENKYDQEDY